MGGVLLPSHRVEAETLNWRAFRDPVSVRLTKISLWESYDLTKWSFSVARMNPESPDIRL